MEIDDIGLRRPTLDDVFISLTGHAAELEKNSGNVSTEAAQGRKEGVQ